MLQLNNLEKLTKKRKRVGRGRSRGGYCGRGNDGQKCRPGANSEISAFFEGGQMPLVRRIPRRGFVNVFKKTFKVVNLTDLENKFSDGDVINQESLRQKGLIKGKEVFPIKVLGGGTLSKKLTVNVNAISESASQAIQKAGGAVQLL